MKRILSVLLVLAMLISCCAAVAEEKPEYVTLKSTFSSMLAGSNEFFDDPTAQADDPEYHTFVAGTLFFEYIVRQNLEKMEMEARPLFKDALLSLTKEAIVVVFELDTELLLTLTFDVASGEITSDEVVGTMADTLAADSTLITVNGNDWSVIVAQLIQMLTGANE